MTLTPEDIYTWIGYCLGLWGIGFAIGTLVKAFIKGTEHV